MKRWILTILALTIAACGGSGGGVEQQPSSVATPSGPSGGSSSSSSSSGSSSSSNSDDDFCTIAISVFWCDDAGGSTASAVHSQVSDAEPNSDLPNAMMVHWPGNTSADQRIGFGVEGTVNAAGDVADFFAFTPQRSADFTISLCQTGQLCGPSAPGYRLPLTSASVRILDQFGAEIFSETLNPGSANLFEARFESGTLYYAVVVAEGIADIEQSYRLTVGENLQQTSGDGESPTSVPGAPQLSAYVVDSFMNVQFDWIPATQNEDGTQLADLAGFNLYIYDYIREGDSAERHLIETINDPSVTTRTINLEGYRDWYVSIASFNEAGIESAHSNGVELVEPPG